MNVNNCHLLDEYTPLHDFVNKSEHEILRYSSYQGLRPLPASCALSFAFKFFTEYVLNCGYDRRMSAAEGGWLTFSESEITYTSFLIIYSLYYACIMQ